MDKQIAKLYKIEMYVLDINNYYKELDYVLQEIEEKHVALNIDFISAEVTEVEWHDDIDINFENCALEDYEKYFIRVDQSEETE